MGIPAFELRSAGLGVTEGAKRLNFEQNGRDLGLVDRFETDQKVLTAAPAGAAAPTGPATAPASPGASRTELIRVFYVVLYPYRLNHLWPRGGSNLSRG